MTFYAFRPGAVASSQRRAKSRIPPNAAQNRGMMEAPNAEPPHQDRREIAESSCGVEISPHKTMRPCERMRRITVAMISPPTFSKLRWMLSGVAAATRPAQAPDAVAALDGSIPHRQAALGSRPLRLARNV
jgi:hypothetical protein